MPFDEGVLADLQSQLPALTCPSCNGPINWEPYTKDRRPKDAPTVDKVIPALGYVPGNVFIICMRCNVLKNDATLAELRNLVEYVEKHAPKAAVAKD